MTDFLKIVRMAPFLIGVLTGCNGLNHINRKMDMASERIGFEKPVYEGRLKSSRVVGPMTSLEFVDGQLYDVSEAPTKLVPGDTVRIYKTNNGFEAHLWKASTDPVLPPPPPPASPAPKHGRK